MQQAFHEQHGLQCGYCTPGFVMAAVSLLRRTRARPRTRSATGSRATSAAARATTTSSARYGRRQGRRMIPAACDYGRAESVEEALELLSGDEDAKSSRAGTRSCLRCGSGSLGRRCSSTSAGSTTFATCARTATRSRSAPSPARGARGRRDARKAVPVDRDGSRATSATRRFAIAAPSVAVAHADTASDLRHGAARRSTRSWSPRGPTASGRSRRRSSSRPLHDALGQNELLTRIRVPP